MGAETALDGVAVKFYVVALIDGVEGPRREPHHGSTAPEVGLMNASPLAVVAHHHSHSNVILVHCANLSGRACSMLVFFLIYCPLIVLLFSWYIPVIFLVCVWCVSGVDLVCVWYFSGMCLVFVWQIWNLSG